MSEDRYYAVRLLWVHDQEGFDEYQDMARPILARHGVHIERWLMTETMVGTGLENLAAKLAVVSGACRCFDSRI